MKLSLLTATGARPEAFALCQKWMAEQTQAFDEWIIVDDGPEPMKQPDGDRFILGAQFKDERIKYRRPDTLWDPESPINTQARNLLLGLEWVTGDVVAIIEDDDCYMPTYLETIMEIFEENEDLQIFGESWTTYYNVRYRCWRKLFKPSYAALYQTSFRMKFGREVFKAAAECHPGNIDQKLWKAATEAEGESRFFTHLLETPPHQTLGIKGLPGRLGVGVGNHMLSDTKHWTRDTDLKSLEKLLKRVPERVEVYAKYWRNYKETIQAARGAIVGKHPILPIEFDDDIPF